MDGYDDVKTPFGPTDTGKPEVQTLIGKNILYSNHQEGLGNWGVLLSIRPELSYPYEVRSETPPYPRKIYTRWIVKQ